MSTTRETYPVHRQGSSVTRLAAVALLVGVAVIGCARHDSPVTTAGSTPALQSSPATATSTPVSIVTASAPIDAASPSESTDPSPTAAAAVTPDPLDSELSNLNNLINGVNSSVSGSDAGTSGGE
jgi:hypothetical protein